MLKEISVKNLLSFRDEVLFSMEADVDRVSEHPEHVVEVNGNKLLKTASMYGPNGGGKSSFLNALILANRIQSNRPDSMTQVMPCKFGDNDVIEETVFFVDDKYEMGYRFAVEPGEIEFEEHIVDDARRKETEKRKFNFVSEEVSYRKAGESEFKSLFKRDNFGAIESERFNGILNNELHLSKTKSTVNYIYENFADNDGELTEDLDVVKHLARQLKSIRKLDLLDRVGLMPLMEDIISEHEDRLVKMMCELDIPIKAIKVVPEDRMGIYFVRDIEVNGITKECAVPFGIESRGTQKIFKILLYLIGRIQDGYIFVCDDMNAYLHPQLFRAIIEVFQLNGYGSQLIFNSHDIINMDNELFRRDEIWFAYRDDNYSSKLVPLSNIVNYKGEQVRKDAKYYKQYLEGKYGADPFIKRGLCWNE